jgi:hypothetical protein
MEALGMQKFRKTRSAEPKYFTIKAGDLNVHTVVKKKIDFIKNKYGDKAKWGDNAIDTDVKAVILMLEEFCTPKKRSKHAAKKAAK